MPDFMTYTGMFAISSLDMSGEHNGEVTYTISLEALVLSPQRRFKGTGMARQVSGETSLKVGARTVRLRLDIGTMMDLEDHFDMGLVPFLSKRLPEFRLGDMAVLYAAMTAADFTDPAARKKAATAIMKVGLVEAAQAISACLEKTLNPQGAGEATGESLGKPKTK